MTEIKGEDPITRRTEVNHKPVKKRNLGRAVVWIMIGLAVAVLFYVISIFVIAGAQV